MSHYLTADTKVPFNNVDCTFLFIFGMFTMQNSRNCTC